MPESLGIVALCEAHATASNTTLPVALFKNSRLLGKLLLSIYRAANTGGGTIWGASLPGPGSGEGKYTVAKGDGSTVAFPTTIPYAALSNNNYLVRISKSARSNAGAATAAVTAGSKTVTGTNTAFTTELRVGDQISVNDEIRTVQQIVSTTSLIVDKAFTNSASGKTLYLVDGFLAPSTDFSVSDNGAGDTFTIGHAASAALWGTGLSTAAGTTNAGAAVPALFAAATGILITPNATPDANTGRVRVVVHYYIPTAPTS